tara:strand:+ start:1116 stop:1925 length:810 start_codon:yes stop_codon:yes gene_type:complete
MKYAIFIYGQYRSFKYNLENNLKEIEESILKNNEIDIYILTNRQGNFSEINSEIIINIFKKYLCNVKFIKIWEDLYEWHDKEKINKQNFDKNCKHEYGKDTFTSNLWFRMYVCNKIINDYCLKNNLKYDLHMFMRLFDTKIKKYSSDELIREKIESCTINNNLLMSIDTIFIGNKNVIDNVFSFGENFYLYHDNIWNDKKLTNYLKLIDYRISIQRNKPTYCSEIQIFSHIFYNISFCENIRFDKCNPNYQDILFHVEFCEKRKFNCYY